MGAGVNVLVIRYVYNKWYILRNRGVKWNSYL